MRSVDRVGGKALSPEDLSIAVFADQSAQRLGLAGLRRECRILALQELAGQHEVDAERTGPGHWRLADNHAQLHPLRQIIVEPLLSIGDDVGASDAGAAYGFHRPAMYRDVVVMARLTVRRECQDRVRSHLTNDSRDLLNRDIEVDRCASAVWIAQPAMIGNSENLQTLGQLDLPDAGELIGRPPRLDLSRRAHPGWP